ncbi:hypothetical protein ACFXHA_30245 [Nocardia sp. NPDC059240]|uniref:hypothetical protein n=1 Tax=Nocardia sp. NPDC059240 TaxID=3346786 RepID=UPI00368AD85B
MKSALTHRLPLLLATGVLAALCATGAAHAEPTTSTLPIAGADSSGSSSGSAQLECNLLALHWEPTTQTCNVGPKSSLDG